MYSDANAFLSLKYFILKHTVHCNEDTHQMKCSFVTDFDLNNLNQFKMSPRVSLILFIQAFCTDFSSLSLLLTTCLLHHNTKRLLCHVILARQPVTDLQCLHAQSPRACTLLRHFHTSGVVSVSSKSHNLFKFYSSHYNSLVIHWAVYWIALLALKEQIYCKEHLNVWYVWTYCHTIYFIFIVL